MTYTVVRTAMNSPCYQTAPNELGLAAAFNPIYRVLFCSRATSSPGGRRQHSRVGYRFIFLKTKTLERIFYRVNSAEDGLQIHICNQPDLIANRYARLY